MMTEDESMLKPKGAISYVRDSSKIVEGTHMGMRKVTIFPEAYYTAYKERK